MDLYKKLKQKFTKKLGSKVIIVQYFHIKTRLELCGLLHNILDWRNEWRGEKSGVPSYFLKVINLSLLYLLLTVEGQKQGETDGWGRDASHSVLWSQIDLLNYRYFFPKCQNESFVYKLFLQSSGADTFYLSYR